MDVSHRVRAGLGRRSIAATLGALLVVAGSAVTGAWGVTVETVRGTTLAAHPSTDAPSPSCDSSDSAYVRYLDLMYVDLFGRPTDPQGLATWMRALDQSGLPPEGWRAAVAGATTSSVEFRGGLVTGSYLRYLHRAPDPAGLDLWLRAMGSGWTQTQVEAALVTSPEYDAQVGSTDQGWVTGMYRDVLGRVPAPSEVAWWTDALQAGTTRWAAALGFLLSREHLQAVVGGYYEHFLHRPIDPSGTATWVGVLRAGGRNEAIIGAVVASTEYWNATTSPAFLVLSPASAVVSSGSGQTYVAQGFDCLVWALGDVTAQTVFTVDGDAAACTGGTCTPLEPGEHVVTGTLGRATGTAVLRVEP